MFQYRKRKKEEEKKKKATKSVLSLGGKKGGKKQGKRVQAHILCLTKQLEEMDKTKWGPLLDFPDNGKLDTQVLLVKPTDGLWKNHTYQMKLVFTPKYPFKEPDVWCLQKIWHPNIDDDGKVCLLRKNWNPTFGLNTIYWGLVFLLHEPNPDDMLNRVAGAQYEDDYEAYKRKALQWRDRHSFKG